MKYFVFSILWKDIRRITRMILLCDHSLIWNLLNVQCISNENMIIMSRIVPTHFFKLYVHIYIYIYIYIYLSIRDRDIVILNWFIFHFLDSIRITNRKWYLDVDFFSWFVYLSNRRHEKSDSCTLCHESCTNESVTVEVARISIRRTQHLRRFSKLNKGVTDHYLNPCSLSKKSNYRVFLNLTSTDMRESSIRRACSSYWYLNYHVTIKLGRIVHWRDEIRHDFDTWRDPCHVMELAEMDDKLSLSKLMVDADGVSNW